MYQSWFFLLFLLVDVQKPLKYKYKTFEIGLVNKESIRILGLKIFFFEKPESITNLIFSNVIDVSAILVEMIIFLKPLKFSFKI